MKDDELNGTTPNPPTNPSESKSDSIIEEPSEKRTESSPKPPIDPEKRKKKQLIGIFVVSLIIMILGISMLYMANRMTQIEKGSLDKDASEKVIAEEVERPLSIDIPGYPKVIALEADQTQSYIDLHNPETNKAYLTFEIVIGDTKDGQFIQKEVLYKSELIAPGFSVDEQALSRALTVGKYDAAINIQAYSYDPATEAVVELNGAQNTVQFNVVDSQ